MTDETDSMDLHEVADLLRNLQGLPASRPLDTAHQSRSTQLRASIVEFLRAKAPLTESESLVLHMDETIGLLESRCPRAARALELKYFAGLDAREIADKLSCSDDTITRDLRFGRSVFTQKLKRRT